MMSSEWPGRLLAMPEAAASFARVMLRAMPSTLQQKPSHSAVGVRSVDVRIREESVDGHAAANRPPGEEEVGDKAVEGGRAHRRVEIAEGDPSEGSR